ncbi:MAG: putative rane protein [Frankiales bacterium]|nr:putative rane protein [Frankiales bacterium]
MLPSATLTAAFLFALVPGWTYLRLRSSRSASLPRVGLDELLEVVAVGLATTGVALAIWAVVPASLSRLADVTALARGPDGYVEAHVRRLTVTMLVVFVLAEVLALLLVSVIHRGPRPHHVRETVWAGALGRGRGDRFTWIGVELRDGRLVEGQLLAYPTGDEHEMRDLALQAPMRVTREPGRVAEPLAYDRLILAEQDIASISVALAPTATIPLAGWRAQWQAVLDGTHRRLSVRPAPADGTRK